MPGAIHATLRHMNQRATVLRSYIAALCTFKALHPWGNFLSSLSHKTDRMFGLCSVDGLYCQEATSRVKQVGGIGRCLVSLME